MKELRDRVAVVTGGAGGIGLELARAFVAEQMAVVIADVEEAALAASVHHLASGGGQVVGVPTDVSDLSSVQHLANSVYEQFGACHVLCNNAGVGAPSAKVWATTPNDWQWVMGVNLSGVIHGILSFVPRMLEGGQEGHIVNTSSPDGPIAPLPTASVYAASKAAVSALTECLAAQLVEDHSRLRASIFYPSGGLLRTGLWTADRNRPSSLARERPRDTEPMTPERLESLAAQGGRTLHWQALDELAALVVRGIKEERYVMMLDRQEAAGTLHRRADALANGDLPASQTL